MNTRSLSIMAIAVAGLSLAGCMPRKGVKQVAKAEPQQAVPQAKALPTVELHLTATVLDAATGQPIPDAWVLVTVHVTTDRPATDYDYKGAAANRMVTGQDGVARINEVQGIYYPQAPATKLYQAIEETRARRLGDRKITGIEGGSIVVAAPKYGFIHQPFAIEDDPAFQGWLRNSPGQKEAYDGWIGRKWVKETLKPLFVQSKDLRTGFEVTLKMHKPSSPDALADLIAPFLFRQTTWTAMSKETGATEDEQYRLYMMFAAQMNEIANETHKPEHVGTFETYMREEGVKYYLNHAVGPQDQPADIQAWLTQKALELLSRENEEVKRYALSILKGVVDEGKDPIWQNHHYDLVDVRKGWGENAPVLVWGAIDERDNLKNEWDWQDARKYYQAGDKAKAYEALGHVLRLLTNLSIPKYTQMEPAKESEFEKAIAGVLKANGNNLPPEYYQAAREPSTGQTLRERFDAVAKQTLADTIANPAAPLASSELRNGYSGTFQESFAKQAFPSVIAQAAGVLQDFYQGLHLEKTAAIPGGPGDGGNGKEKPKYEVADSTGTASSAGRGDGGDHGRKIGISLEDGVLRCVDDKGKVSKELKLDHPDPHSALSAGAYP